MTEQRQTTSNGTMLAGGGDRGRSRPARSGTSTRSTAGPRAGQRNAGQRRAGQRTDRHTALVLTQLSAVVSQLHGIRAILPDDRGLHGRLTAVEQELEAIGQQVLIGPGVEATPRTSAKDGVAVDGEQLSDAERSLMTWLERCHGSDTSTLTRADRDEQAMRKLLRDLTTSRQRPPAVIRDRFGLSEQATIGDVAMELLLAVDGPHGPHCRSYRSAVYFLTGRAELAGTC